MTIRAWTFAAFAIGFLFVSHLAVGQAAKVASPIDPISERDRDHPKQREEWFMRGRRVPDQSAAALRYRAHQQKLRMRTRKAARRTSASPASTVNSSWTPLGPAPLASDAGNAQDYGLVSGRATSVAIDPADNSGNTVYVGGAYGGVWKSTNAGSNSPSPASVTWTPLIDNQPTLAVGAIAIQPGNNNSANSLVLVGTGEANSSVDSYYGLGILRSTDAGSTWNLISTSDGGSLSFQGLGITKLAFSTAQTNTVVASAATASAGVVDGAFTSSTVRGLYTSTNAGLTWGHQTPRDGTTPIDPTSATAVVYNATAGKFYAALRFHGLYSSVDGLNWARLSSQPGGSALSTAACPPASTSPSSCPMYRGEIAVVPNRNEMYVWYVSISASGAEVDRGIWKSSDGGANWTQVSENGLTSCGDVNGCGVEQGVYNLALAAIPNGPSATDVYAGAVNLFKCTLLGGTTCTEGTTPGWLNLTHVYGCTPTAAPAHVHPDQHGIAFMIASSGKDVMYFANDGGIYRALDGFMGLNTGSCSGSNQFDSLNQNLGSMTQFVSFSLHPTDANTVLGGTQDNGSPATSRVTTNPQWKNVNAGDGGYNAIIPSSPADWFVSNPDVPPRGLEIDHCSGGINCNTISFANGAVVTSSQLGGDDGGFYFPYILDPQSDHELLIGTCRVWRGGPSTSLGSYIALSNNLEVGGSSVCTGGEVNQVRALAAGGPKDSNGFSNVIYAGADGLGPLNAGGAGGSGGRVFVTTNAAAAGAGKTAIFSDVTLNINANNYPISSIAIDTSDASGQTAYVTIMGFGTPHVWQTTNAGASWADFSGTGTGALPDAPANSVLVDSANGTIFVGTDVGVFSSSTASPNWSEVGPSSGASGFLPNVPVTALRLFNSGGSKRLRASTYGRGIWENALVVGPDYQITVNDSPLILFPGQIRDFNGFVTPLNGYSSTVDLTCSGSPLPSTCSSISVTPGDPNPFALTVGNNSVQDFNFDIKGVGTDPAAISHTAPVTLRVVDFTVGTPHPGSVDIVQGAASQPISIQLSGLGSFTDFINLSCNRLPAGANCNFDPPNPVGPVSSNGFPVTLTVNTSSNTPLATTSVTIQGDVSGENGPKTQNLDVRVTSRGFSMSITNSALRAVDGGTATYTGTLTAINGYNSSVNINCNGGTIPSTCAAVAVTPSASGQPFSLDVSNTAAANLSFNLQAVGSDPATFTQTLPVTFTVAQDFTLATSAASQTVQAGGTATYNLTVAPAGHAFDSSISFTCSGLPGLTQCSLPAPVTPGAIPVPVTLMITTTAPIAVLQRQGFIYAVWLPAFGMTFLFAGFLNSDSRRKRVTMYVAIGAILLLTVLQPACGGGGGSGGGPQPQPGTLAGTYTVTLHATSGAQSHTLPLTLIVQ